MLKAAGCVLFVLLVGRYMVCLAIGNVHKRKFVSFTFLGPFLSPVVLVCQAKYYHVCFIITLAYGRRVHRRWYIDLHTFHGRNPAPVDTVGSLSHYLQGFHTSQVVQDFFHQQDQSSSLYFHVFVRMRVIFYTRYILLSTYVEIKAASLLTPIGRKSQ